MDLSFAQAISNTQNCLKIIINLSASESFVTVCNSQNIELHNGLNGNSATNSFCLHFAFLFNLTCRIISLSLQDPTLGSSCSFPHHVSPVAMMPLSICRFYPNSVQNALWISFKCVILLFEFGNNLFVFGIYWSARKHSSFYCWNVRFVPKRALSCETDWAVILWFGPSSIIRK